MARRLACPKLIRLTVTIMVIALALWVSPAAMALETDQFTTPPAPLADIGEQVSQRVRDILSTIIQQVNADIEVLAAKRDAATDDATRAQYQAEIAAHLTGNHIADLLYREIGAGIPETSLERWIRTNNFGHDEPSVFEVPCSKSVTGICLQRPLIMIGLAPTVNMFGSYFGTDKMGHFFQQGYENFEIDIKGRAAGLSDADRHEQVINKGKELENGVFGMFLSGIYSNADLAADYAGYKFYLNLTEQVVIGRNSLAPMLLTRNERWQFNPKRTASLMQPFISDHLNEALNPCEYEKAFQADVQAAVAERAPTTLAFYHTTAEREIGRLEQLATWHGEPYGHSGFKNLITLPNAMGIKMMPGVVMVKERPDTARQTAMQ